MKISTNKIKFIGEEKKPDRPFRVKFGIDPTSPDLHLGHLAPLLTLRELQDAGHIAVIVIGDFTAAIGDPTGRDKTRPQLSQEAIAQNAESIIQQLEKVLDFSEGKIEIHRNSQWLNQISNQQLMMIFAHFSTNQLMSRSTFTGRIEANEPIFLHELIYPIMQGLDSVEVRADVEIGGTDQTFNIVTGRAVQSFFGMDPQFGILLPILTGTDGDRKMSKSFHNCVNLSDDAATMFSKIQAVPDNTILEWADTFFPGSMEEVQPRDRQKLVAQLITQRFHGFTASLMEFARVEAIGQKGWQSVQPEEVAIPTGDFPAPLAWVMSQVGICPSTSEGRRQIRAGIVWLDGKPVTDSNLSICRKDLFEKTLRVGKKKIIKFIK